MEGQISRASDRKEAAMKSLALVAVMLVALVANPAWANMADEIIVLSQNGVSQEIMISFINENPRGLLRLTAGDIVRLKDAGVTDRVIKALLLRQNTVVAADENQAARLPVPAQVQPQNYQPVTTAPAAPIYNDVTYNYDYPNYPVPIYPDYPMFSFGVDLFTCPWSYGCYYGGCSFGCGWGPCLHGRGLWNGYGGHGYGGNGYGHSVVSPTRWGGGYAGGAYGTGSGRVPGGSGRLGATQGTGVAAVANRPLALSANHSAVNSPVVGRTGSSQATRTSSYSSVAGRSSAYSGVASRYSGTSSYRSYAAPSSHSYTSRSYRSYSAPTTRSYGGSSSSWSGGGHGYGGGHSYGGGGHSFGGGGHGFGGGGHGGGGHR